MLVQIIKNWEDPNFLKQIPLSVLESDIVFTYDDVRECDVVLVLNYLSKPITVHCPMENIWLLIQEPYEPNVYGWVAEKHQQYDRVYTHTAPTQNTRYRMSHPALPWRVKKTYSELVETKLSIKPKNISWVTSHKKTFTGHKRRMRFYDFLIRQSEIEIDMYGSGINYIEDKWDALYDYSYSLAIENSSTDNYWTEKISDCFLSYTLPFYYGCTNLEDYFPVESFIRIDITNPAEAISIMKKAQKENEWEKRIPAIIEARNRVLHKYNFFQFFSNELSNTSKQVKKTIHSLRPYKPSLLWTFQNKMRGLINI